jgi:hypothetical protein
MRLDTLAQIQLARGACADAVSSWERALKGVPPTRTKERDDMTRAMSHAQEHCRS